MIRTRITNKVPNGRLTKYYCWNFMEDKNWNDFMRTCEEIDIGYPIIIGLIWGGYWYMDFSVEVYDVATVMGIFWMYWKIASRHPKLSNQFRSLIAVLTVCSGLIAYCIAIFMFPNV